MADGEEIIAMFGKTPWGSAFTQEETNAIAQYLRLQTHEPGECIFQEGDLNNYMAFVIDGHVDILKGSSDSSGRIIVTLSRGALFGEMTFIDDAPRSATATARDKVTLLIFSAESFEELAAANPALGLKIMRKTANIICQRLRLTTFQLVYLRK
ncbi:MAG: cyclic nucleotide-binding domain-containing protein [Desulfovibrionaceae bacterium]|nr:cyclic nucleotide-binding domain-containing protein [Desulfovibrionaceae bacterium]MBF0515437.1 cyclic nucleotide-binding domain-containing protein [Desulfovibrionaceae bacterium]